MSAISLKSISGITSITTPAGVDNQLTLHNNNTTEAVKLDTAGNLHFHNHLNITGISTAANFKTGTSNLHSTGLNIFDLDVDGHTELDNGNVSGVVTFTNSPNAIQMNDDARVSFGTSLKTSIAYNTSSSRTIIRNYNDTLEIGYRNVELHHINQARLTIAGANTFSADANTTFTGANYSVSWIPSSNTFRVNDNAKLAFGTQSDIEFYHNGSNFYIQNDTGHIYIQNNVAADVDKNIYLQAKNGENSITCENDGEVYLFSNQVSANQQKLRTSNTGIYVTGIGTFTDKVSVTGSQNSILTNNQLIFDRAGTSYIDNSNDSGALSFRIGSSYTVGLFIESDGTVAIPSKLMHLGDTNTFMEFGTDTINFDTAGTERLRITSGGFLGIGAGAGTNKPLHIYTGSSDSEIRLQTNSGTEQNSYMSLRHSTGDLDFYTVQSGTNMKFHTVNTERLRIASNGQIRMNTAGSPAADLHVGGTGAALNAYFVTSRISGAYHHYAIGNSGASLGYIGSAGQISGSGGATGFAFRSEDHIQFCSGGATERLRITSDGKLLINSSTVTASYGGKLQLTNSNFAMNSFANNQHAQTLLFAKSRATSGSGGTIVGSGDFCGHIEWYADDGVDTANQIAKISGQMDGTPGANDTPGKLLFHTTADGANTSTLRMQISSGGVVHIGSTAVSNTIPTGGLDLQGNNTNCILEMGNPLPNYSAGRVPTFRITTRDADKAVDLSSMWGGTNGIYKHITFAGGVTNFYNGTSDAEVVRITGSGLTVGTTSLSDGVNTDEGVVLNENGQVMCRRNSTMFTAKSIATGGYTAFRVLSAQTQVGSISFNSGGTSFNTSSDYRRKENVIDLTGAITRLKTLKPKRFNFISNPSVTLDGFLAHEVTTVPEAVTGTKDEVATEDIEGYTKGDPIYQQLDQSKLVPLLVAALQEAVTKIETLETKVAALESS